MNGVLRWLLEQPLPEQRAWAVAFTLAFAWLAGLAWGVWTRGLGLVPWQRAITAFAPAVLVRVALSTRIAFLFTYPPRYFPERALPTLERASVANAALVVLGTALGVLAAWLLERRRTTPTPLVPLKLGSNFTSALAVGGLVFAAWLAVAALNYAGYDRFLGSLLWPRCVALWEQRLPCDATSHLSNNAVAALNELGWFEPGQAYWRISRQGMASGWPYLGLFLAELATLSLAGAALLARRWPRVERVLAALLIVSVTLLASFVAYCVTRGRAEGIRDAASALAAQEFVTLSMLGGALACGFAFAVLSLRRSLGIVSRCGFLVAAMAAGVMARFALEQATNFDRLAKGEQSVSLAVLRLQDERALVVLAALSLVLTVAYAVARSTRSWRNGVPFVLGSAAGSLLVFPSIPFAHDARLSVRLPPRHNQVVVSVCSAPWRPGHLIVGDSYAALEQRKPNDPSAPVAAWSLAPELPQQLADSLAGRLRAPDEVESPTLPPDARVIGLAALPSAPIADVRGALQGIVLAHDPTLVLVIGQTVRDPESATLPNWREHDRNCAIGRFLVSRKAPPRTVSTLGELLASSAPFNPFP